MKLQDSGGNGRDDEDGPVFNWSRVNVDDAFGRSVEDREFVILDAHPVMDRFESVWLKPVRRPAPGVRVMSDSSAIVHLDINPGLGGHVYVDAAESIDQPCPQQGEYVGAIGTSCYQCGEVMDQKGCHPKKGTAKLPGRVDQAPLIHVLGVGMKQYKPEEDGRFVRYLSYLIQMDPPEDGKTARVRIKQGGTTRLFAILEWNGEKLELYELDNSRPERNGREAEEAEKELAGAAS